MKASELIERLAKYIKENGDREVYTWNHMLMKHNPIETTYFIDDSFFKKELIGEEDYSEDFKNIYHNIVIN